MTAATVRRDPGNAFVAIGDLARSASIEILVALETLGLVAALGIYFWTPARWPFALPCIGVSALGLWGVCEHVIAARVGHRYKGQRRMLRWLARAIAVAGTASALLAVYLFMGWVMGVYIS